MLRYIGKGRTKSNRFCNLKDFGMRGFYLFSRLKGAHLIVVLQKSSISNEKYDTEPIDFFNFVF